MKLSQRRELRVKDDEERLVPEIVDYRWPWRPGKAMTNYAEHPHGDSALGHLDGVRP